MAKKLPNYIRTHRKRNGLTQAELAFLLGYRDGAKISLYENFCREATLETALACEVIFQIPVRKLFGGVFSKVESDTLQRIALLVRKLDRSEPTRKTDRERVALLIAVLENLGNNKNEQ